MKIENANWNWFAFDLLWYDARNAPDRPPKAAGGVAKSLVFTSGLHAHGRDSSSRIAIHARPSGVARQAVHEHTRQPCRRIVRTIVLRLSLVERHANGRSDLSIA